MGVARGQAEEAGENRESLQPASTAGIQIRVDKEEYIGLRGAAAYWKARHGEAVQREADLKRDNEELRARIRELEGRLYSRRSECLVSEGKSPSRRPVSSRPRGQQPGSRGHGRSSLEGLEAREEVAELPQEQQKGPRCGRPLDPFPGTDEAQVVEIETRVWRRVIRRRRYHPSCGCGVLPGIVTAPSPARLIRRGKLGISVWVRVILDKYLYSRPSHRLLQQLASPGVRLSPGTIAGGLRQLLPLLEPVREAIRSRQLSEDRWQADETGWRVFVEVEGKAGQGWHLWVFGSPSRVLFTLSPSRSAQVPEAHFGADTVGILLSDRYVVYKKLARQWEGLELAFCWAHVRRDFFCLAKAWPEQEGGAMSWVEGIGGLFDLNRRRRQVRKQPESFAAWDRELRGALWGLARQRDAELGSPTLPKACKKVLRSLERHWEGLTVFLDHPEVAMDNNAAERALRGPVVGRKNYYGSGSSVECPSGRGAVHDPADLGAVADQPATLAELLSAILRRIGQPGTAAIEEIPALGNGPRPKSGLGSTLGPGGGMKRYCGRRFTGEEIGQLCALIADNPGRTRAQLSRLACRLLQGRKADGGLKEMSCRVAMLRLHREGLLQLPPPRNRKGGSSRIEHTFWSAPQPPLSRPVQELPGVHLEPVLSRPDSALWNEYIDRYHYLGHTPLPGAQLRDFARWEDRILALLGFGAPAWKTAPRDRFIGWRPSERERNLQLIVNNARFLILPWVQSKNLASKLLALASRQLPQDWQDRYAYRPVLLETFVETQRFTGACYKAANWIHVGQTQGRGKLDRDHKADLPTKSIWLYPLSRHFRRSLRST